MTQRNDIDEHEMFDPLDSINVQLYEHDNRLEYLEDQIQSIMDFFRLLKRVLMCFPVEPNLIPDLAWFGNLP